MKSGSKPAKRGYDYEKKFIDLVNLNKLFNACLKQFMSQAGHLIAKKVQDNKRKADVEIVINKAVYGCSIKTTEADFSQLDRRWLRDLASVLNMPQNVNKALDECIKNRQINKKDKFILDKHASLIANYFSQNKCLLLKELFLRKDHTLKYMVICDFVKNIWCLIKMEDVIAYIENNPVTISPKGILYFGDCLTMQRKGGNGKHVKVPKSDPMHPGNQLQFKLRPLSLVLSIDKSKRWYL